MNSKKQNQTKEKTLYLRLNIEQQIFICSANIYQVPSACLGLEGTVIDIVRSVLPPGEILSVEGNPRCLCVPPKGDTPKKEWGVPEHRGIKELCEYSGENPLFPTGGKRASKRRRYQNWVLKER